MREKTGEDHSVMRDAAERRPAVSENTPQARRLLPSQVTLARTVEMRGPALLGNISVFAHRLRSQALTVSRPTTTVPWVAVRAGFFPATGVSAALTGE
jgi:hypothetical protein